MDRDRTERAEFVDTPAPVEAPAQPDAVLIPPSRRDLRPEHVIQMQRTAGNALAASLLEGKHSAQRQRAAVESTVADSALQRQLARSATARAQTRTLARKGWWDSVVDFGGWVLSWFSSPATPAPAVGGPATGGTGAPATTSSAEPVAKTDEPEGLPSEPPVALYEDAVKQAQWPVAAGVLNEMTREDVVQHVNKLSVAQIRQLHQGALANAKVGPNSQVAQLTPKLLTDFEEKFPDSADTIRLSPEAVKLVNEAEQAKATFGGFAEDGPAKDPWPYTVGSDVYVPKAHTDKVVAMSDFLFELNNAIRAPQFAALEKKAAAGAVDAKQYARESVAHEVDGMLRLGEVWFQTKKALGGDKALDKYDMDNYQVEYKAFLDGTKTRDDIIDDVLQRKYTEGVDAGKTVEQFYMEQFESGYGKKDKK